ncbi:MAG: carboxypeptidase-like regulatory domain-containing protein, partial [Actinomycetota bacterium]
ECWAVGSYYLDYPYSGSPRQAPLALHMDAAGTWQVADLPANARPLSGVDCAATDDCWAVGSPPSLASPTKTTTVHWDGTEWAIASSPSKLSAGKPTANVLRGLDCSSTECWAVGHYAAGRDSQTLALHYASTASPQPNLSDVAFSTASATAGQHSDESLFEARLTDSTGEPLSGRDLTFELVGTGSPRTFTSTTNADGVAVVTPTLEEKPGPHHLTVRFVGDNEHVGDADTISFVVAKEDTDLELSVQGAGNDKTLDARLFDLDASSGIMGRTIDFYSDGELIGSHVTTGDGVASVAVPPAHRGNNRTYEAVFEGDDFFLESANEKPGNGSNGGGGGAGAISTGRMNLV